MDTVFALLAELGFTKIKDSEELIFRSQYSGLELELPLDDMWKNYLVQESISQDIFTALQKLKSNDIFNKLLSANEKLAETIRDIKCNEESLRELLKQIQLLELKILLYYCRETQKIQQTESPELTEFINAIQPKLVALNSFYDAKLSQTGGFSNQINYMYKGLKYKSKLATIGF